MVCRGCYSTKKSHIGFHRSIILFMERKKGKPLERFALGTIQKNVRAAAFSVVRPCDHLLGSSHSKYYSSLFNKGLGRLLGATLQKQAYIPLQSIPGLISKIGESCTASAGVLALQYTLAGRLSEIIGKRNQKEVTTLRLRDLEASHGALKWRSASLAGFNGHKAHGIILDWAKNWKSRSSKKFGCPITVFLHFTKEAPEKADVAVWTISGVSEFCWLGFLADSLLLRAAHGEVFTFCSSLFRCHCHGEISGCTISTGLKIEGGKMGLDASHVKITAHALRSAAITAMVRSNIARVYRKFYARHKLSVHESYTRFQPQDMINCAKAICRAPFKRENRATFTHNVPGLPSRRPMESDSEFSSE